MEEWRERKKQERRQARRYEWVKEGKEQETPQWISLIESLAQASPDTIEEIKRLIGN